MASVQTPSPTVPAGAELRVLLGLAWPVIVAELGWVTMWIVDSMMVGRLGAAELGAVGFGGQLFFVAAILGLGMLLALDFPIALAVGAGDLRRAHRTLAHGLHLAAALSVVLTLALLAAASHLDVLVRDPAVHAPMRVYLRVTAWSMAPLLLFTALRR
jgi:MATE family multidrug resistance protein